MTGFESGPGARHLRDLLPALAAGMFLAAAGPSAAENWPQFRGPRADGTSLERGLPTAWSRDRGVCWSTELPGEGYSSPIVVGGSAFVTTALGDGRERALVRLDAATGRILWTKVVATSADLESLHSENSHVSSTPAADARAIYTSFYESGKVHLAAVAYDGRILWTATPLRYRSEHGYHHNPVLLGDQLVLNYDQQGDAAVLSLDTTTGRVRWRTPLANDYNSNVPPLPVSIGGRTLLATVGNDVTRVLDPRDGRVLFKAAGPTRYCVAGAAFGDGVLFVHGGYPDRRSLGFRLEPDGEGVRGSLAWESTKGTSYVPSPVFHDGHLYVVSDGGLATAWEARTGAVKWQERLSGRFRASAALAEGRVYATNDAGTTTVFKASPQKYEEIARNDLGELVYATPALASGRIYVRTKSRLVAVGCAAQ